MQHSNAPSCALPESEGPSHLQIESDKIYCDSPAASALKES